MEDKIRQFKLLKELPYYPVGSISKYDVLTGMYYFENKKYIDGFCKWYKTWKFLSTEIKYLIDNCWIEELTNLTR